MRIQALAVIAIIIILPMTLLLNEYSKNQIKTLQLQVLYDSKLSNATYDAIKTFQLNMTNSDTSDLADSKMRDIKASINVFFTSLASNFNMSGYGKEVLQNYVPAVVYTLYDGYYIYSDYKNILDENDIDGFDLDAAFKNNEDLYGLKPYIYYSCRYVKGNIDVVITYSLDSYVTIQGKINDNAVNESGYLLTGVSKRGSDYYYKGVKILEENSNEGLKQNVYVDGGISNYFCKKINGVKYYCNDGPDSDNTFAIINGRKLDQASVKKVNENTNGIQYYEDAYEFKQKFNTGGILNPIINLKPSDAVDINGEKYTGLEENNPYSGNYSIFGNLTANSNDGPFIEDENSEFNAHRLQVIKNSIESNLIPAISNYNKISTSSVNFQMPKLNDIEWEQITTNISMITFLQGISIGGKVYNGHSIISNNNNEDYVSEDSIYIANNGEYHRITDEDLLNDSLDGAIGIFNTDFQRRASQDEDDDSKIYYYYPKMELACYNSIVNSNSETNRNSINEFLKGIHTLPESNKKYKLAQIYYTALGRERYGMYRVTNKLEDVQEVMLNGFR